jgi:hypothetical protein
VNPSAHRNRWLTALIAASALILTMSEAAHAGTNGAHRASAPADTPNCGSATFCAYQDRDFNHGTNGAQWNYTYARSPHLAWFYVGNNAQDQFSSLNNSRAWITYASKNCPPDSHTTHAWGPGEVATDLSQGYTWPDNSPMNDSISGLAFGTSTTTQALNRANC